MEKGRPPTTDDVKIAISKIQQRHPDWGIRIIEKQFPGLFPKLKDQAPGRTFIAKYLKETVKPNEQKISASGIDNPWNTASLNTEPINSEAIPSLIGLQISRKKFLSKPITIREAKWFNRFFGFRNYIVIEDSEVENDPNLKKTVLSHVMATWAQIYAYKETIDTIAGIKPENNDYSDLDTCMFNNDWVKLSAEYVYRYKRLEEEEIEVLQKQKNVERFNKFFLSFSLEAIWLLEAQILGYTLGSPELPDDSLFAYVLFLYYLGLGKIFPDKYYSQVGTRLPDEMRKILEIPENMRGYLINIKKYLVDNQVSGHEHSSHEMPSFVNAKKLFPDLFKRIIEDGETK